MKKLAAGILSAALMLSIGTASVFAAGFGRNFVDTNRDGVCDYARTSCMFTDTDGDGICDNCGVRAGGNVYGRNFVDNDGDGICDNYSTRTRPQNGTGRGYGCRGGRSR